VENLSESINQTLTVIDMSIEDAIEAIRTALSRYDSGELEPHHVWDDIKDAIFEVEGE